MGMHWKLKKRVSVPDGVFELLAEFRTLVETMQIYYKQFVGADVMTYLDVEKVSRLLARLEQGGHPIPPQFAVIYFKARALDYVQFNRFEDFCTMLAEAKPYPKVTGEETSDILELTLEICSVKVINGASAATEDAGMQKVKDFLGMLMSKIAPLPLRLAGANWEFSPPCSTTSRVCAELDLVGRVSVSWSIHRMSVLVFVPMHGQQVSRVLVLETFSWVGDGVRKLSPLRG